MKIFVAGARGAIGQPLIAAMVRHGHTVTGMSRDEAGTQKLVDMGVTVAIVNAFDGAAVEQALRRSQANVVDDDPSPVSRWLPAFARWVGAPPPPVDRTGGARGRR